MFFKYFSEIRNRLVLTILTWFFACFSTYINMQKIVFLFIKPSIFVIDISNLYFVFTEVTEVFSIYLQIMLFVGNQITLIYVFYHLILFLAPGLYFYEYNYIKTLFTTSFLLWILSAFCFNNYLFPWSWNFFLNFYDLTFNHIVSFHFESKLSEYFNFYKTLYQISFFNFQIIIVLFIYFKYFKVKLQTIRKTRRVIYMFLVILSTIITPPDIVSQLLLSLNFIIIYESLIYYHFFKLILNKSNSATN